MSHFPTSLVIGHIMQTIYSFLTLGTYQLYISFIWSSTQQQPSHLRCLGNRSHECHERLPSLASAVSSLRPWTHLAVGFGRSATSAIRLELQPGAFPKRDPLGVCQDAGEGMLVGILLLLTFRTLNMHVLSHTVSLSNIPVEYIVRGSNAWKLFFPQLSTCRQVKTFWVYITVLHLSFYFFSHWYVSIYVTYIPKRLTVMIDGRSVYILNIFLQGCHPGKWRLKLISTETKKNQWCSPGNLGSFLC